MKTLSITLYNRPKYTQQLFDALDDCSNINEYQIFIFCEPVANVVNMAKNYRTNQTTLFVNSERLGCNKNIFQALSYGHNINNDFHIHFEDDTIPGRDCLLYLEWAKEAYRNDENILTITAFNKIDFSVFQTTNPEYVSKRNWFTPWVWGTWYNRWVEFSENFKHLIYSINDKSWDFLLNEYIRKNRGEIYPIISRSQNIGAELGTHVPSPEWHRANHHLEYWIESSKNYRDNFSEI